MVNMQVLLNEIPNCIRAVAGLQDRESIMEDIAQQVESDMLTEALDRCPGPESVYYPTDSTGNLQASHESTSTASNDDITVTIINTADYAIYVHNGHGTVEARPWLTETMASIVANLDTYQTMLMDWVSDVFEGEL